MVSFIILSTFDATRRQKGTVMNLLLTNDDGYQQPGLLALARAADRLGHRGMIVAPYVQQSAKSQSFTLTRPLFVHEQPAATDHFPVYAIEGTPTDCARIGLQKLMKDPVDVVISGINYGWNLGTAVYYSGTFGAAREGAFHHVPSIAVSAHEQATPAMIAYFAEQTILIAEKLVKQSLPRNTVFNLNFPQCAPEECLKLKQAPLDSAFFADTYVAYDTPRAGRCYFMEAGVKTEPTDLGSDVDLVRQGYPVFTVVGGVQSVDSPDLVNLLDR